MSEPEQAPTVFNPFDPAFRANPYPFYRTLHGQPPTVIAVNQWRTIALVGGHADCVRVLRDHQSFSSERAELLGGGPGDPFEGAVTMLSSDPPDHTRLRGLVSRDFTPRRIRELEPRIREIAQTLVNQAAARGRLEVMGDIANVLPVMVIAEMLGIAPESHAQFKEWSDTIIAPRARPPGAPLSEEFVAARQAMRDFFSAEIERRRTHPGPDLVSALVAAHDTTDTLSTNEMLRFLILLLIAGNETTTNLIGNGMLALARNPGEQARLRADESLLPSAIEEMVRYDGPVQLTIRRATSPAVVGGVELAQDTLALVMLACANRDPNQFPDPERFDVARQPNDHIAFGAGIHHCLGAALARLEARIAIGAILQRFGSLRLAEPNEPLTYKGSFGLRGLAALPLEVDR